MVSLHPVPGSRSLQLAAAFCLTFALPGPAAALDAVETKLVAAIESRRQVDLELLHTAVDVNSGTLNFDGVRRVGALFAAEFEGLGFATRWIDGAPFERAGHLIAKRTGVGPHALLIGHLDTVFEPDSPFQRYEDLGEGEAKGPGITDMKGGNVVMLSALGALEAAGVLDRLRVTVVLTGDEEKSGRPLDLARAELLKAAADADFALGFEDGDSSPKTAVIARRGSSSWRLEVTGTPAHSSQIFQEEVGAGALFEAARILEGFRNRLTEFRDLTFNPGAIVGGTEAELDSATNRGTVFGKNNVVAATAVVTGDLRALSPQQYEDAVLVMQAVVAESLPHTSATLTLSPGYPPMAATDDNRRLLAAYDEASRDLGHGEVTAVDPRRAGAADISFVAGIVPGALDGLGLMGRGGHTEDEVADLTTLTSQSARAAVLLYRLSRAD